MQKVRKDYILIKTLFRSHLFQFLKFCGTTCSSLSLEKRMVFGVLLEAAQIFWENLLAQDTKE